MIVVALGDNALDPPDNSPHIAARDSRIRVAAVALAALADRGKLVVTHGNGPQVGWLALDQIRRAEPDPLDVLDALTEGQLGYVISQAIGNERPARPVATLLTRVTVDGTDGAMARPSKRIGPLLSDVDARRFELELGWTVAEVTPGRWRRVVASPEPVAIVELAAISALLDTGHIVVCAGGGGIPVVRTPDGRCHGVEAVVDKDLASSLLAIELGADALVMLTDVDAVSTDFGTPQARRVHKASVAALRAMSFEAGSMAPKVEAACRFAERSGGVAGIGRLEQADELLAGRAGTLVVAGDVETRWWDPAS